MNDLVVVLVGVLVTGGLAGAFFAGSEYGKARVEADLGSASRRVLLEAIRMLLLAQQREENDLREARARDALAAQAVAEIEKNRVAAIEDAPIEITTSDIDRWEKRNEPEQANEVRDLGPAPEPPDAEPPKP